jgi:outer membrane receptor protein involved in Fe transport
MERSALELSTSFTWQEARDVGRSPTYRGKMLPNLPEREGYAGLRWNRGAWDLRWDLSLRSWHYRDRYNSEAKRTPASVVHGASMTRSFLHPDLSVRAEVQNLFDRRIEDIDGFPLPGRALQAEVTWTR